MSLPHSNTGVIDSRVDVPVEKDEAVEKAFAFYGALPSHAFSARGVPDELHLRVLESLSPIQIDQVAQRIIAQMPECYVLDNTTGIYLTQLIQKSYNEGNNDFMLHTKNIPLNCLGFELKGYCMSYLKLSIFGNTGANTLNSSSYVQSVHHGDVNYGYLHETKRSDATLLGTMHDSHYGTMSLTKLRLIDLKFVKLRLSDKKTYLAIKQVRDAVETAAKGYVLPICGNEFILIDDAGKELEAFRQ